VPMPSACPSRLPFIHVKGFLKLLKCAKIESCYYTTGMFSAQFFEKRGLFEVARSERRRVIAVSRNLHTVCSDPRGDSQKLDVDTADHT
jgi:hypothetical protein